MKKRLSVILTAMMVLCLMVSAFSSAAVALDSGDWEIVHHSTGTPANAMLETTPNNGIRLAHEGHYPSSNAGLLYTQPLNLTEGISLNVTVETDSSDSTDAWYGIFLMNKPVYFDVGSRSEEDGYGIVLLARTRGFEWMVVDGSFHNVATVSLYDMAEDKEYYDPGVNVTFTIKHEGDELNVYVDDVQVPYDFSDLLQYFTGDQAYIGFSMSDTDLIYQSFTVNYLNGQQPASEGDAITLPDGQGPTVTTSSEPTVDYDNVDSFTFIDFTDPNVLSTLTSNDCKLSYDEEYQALKVEVTGPDPFFNIPMKKANYFDGDKFCILKMEYKTDFEGLSEFFYSTKDVPDMGLCNLQFDIEPTDGEFKVWEQDMQESSNWTGQIRNFRVDPAAAGEEGQVFYYKNINFEVYVEPETEPRTTTEAVETPAAEVTTDAAEETTTATETKDAVTTGKTDTTTKSQGIPAFVWVIIAVAAVAIVAVVVVIILKNKKK